MLTISRYEEQDSDESFDWTYTRTCTAIRPLYCDSHCVFWRVHFGGILHRNILLYSTDRLAQYFCLDQVGLRLMRSVIMASFVSLRRAVRRWLIFYSFSFIPWPFPRVHFAVTRIMQFSPPVHLKDWPLINWRGILVYIVKSQHTAVHFDCRGAGHNLSVFGYFVQDVFPILYLNEYV